LNNNPSFKSSLQKSTSDLKRTLVAMSDRTGLSTSVRLQMKCCTPAWLRCRSCLNMKS